MGLQRMKGKGAQPTPPAAEDRLTERTAPPFEWYPVETLPPVALYGGVNEDDRDRPIYTVDVLALGWLYAASDERQPFTVQASYNFVRRRWVFAGRHSLEASGYRFECRYWSLLPPIPADMIDQVLNDVTPAEPAPEGIDNAPAN